MRRTWTYQQLRVRTERGVPLDIMFYCFLLKLVVGMEKGRSEVGGVYADKGATVVMEGSEDFDEDDEEW